MVSDVNIFATTSQSPVSKLFRFSESLGETNGNKVGSDLNTSAHKGYKIAAQKKFDFLQTLPH